VQKFLRTVTVLIQIEACIPALRRYAAALLRNREEADNLVHNCLVRALDKLHTRRDEADVRAWLFTIMHNLCIRQLRWAKVLAGDPPNDTHEAAINMRPEQENSLQWHNLLRGLNRLPMEQRAVMLLVSVGDLSYAETAQVLGIPIGTAMSRLASGRERLRQLVAEEEVPPALRRTK
jgi:RNA polymerase sigma-70 factor, ECF subfamily